MNRYEVIFIALSDLPKEEIDVLVERYKQITADFKGLVVKVEKWGVRKLAYPINKQARGAYCLIDYVGTAATVNELERNLKYDDKILRYQTVKKAEKVDMAEIEKEISGVKEEKVEEPQPEAPQPEAPATAPAVEETPVVSEEVKTDEVVEKVEEGVNE